MPQSDVKEILRWLERREQLMLATLGDLVKLESPSSSKTAVDRLGARLAREFEKIGGAVTFHKQGAFGDHLQADFAGGGKPTMLLGHFDTVWDVGTLAKMPFKIEASRARGPGVYDMKAGIVQMLYAISAVQEMKCGSGRPIMVWLVSDEEVGSDSSRTTTEKLARRCERVYVCEPSAGPKGALKTGRKGVGEYVVKVAGVASHAGLDFEKGHSAIIELAQQIRTIAGFTDLKRGLTFNPGVIRGGTRTNVVAAEAAVEVDVRIARLKDAVHVEKKFRQLKPFDKKCKVEVTGGINRPPMERTAKNLGLFKDAQKVAAELGFKLEERTVGGGSDGNFTSGLGIPTLDGLGAVGEGAHAVNESIVISELAKRTALLAGLISL